MEYIPSAFSIVAIVISALSLWNAWRARRSSEDSQYHSQIVSFEQRKQEVRQRFLENQMLTIEINNELNRFPDSEWLREKLSQLGGMRHQHEISLKGFDEIPSSPSTEARLKLERIGGAVLAAHKGLQTGLQVVRDKSPTK